MLGFLLIGAAQYLISQRDFVFLRHSFAPWLQTILHPSVPNFENVLTSILLLCIAGVLIFRAAAFRSSEGSTVFFIENPPNLLQFARRHWSSLLAAAFLIGYVLYNLTQKDTSPGLVFLWLLALALLMRVMFYYDREAGTSLSLRLTRLDALLLLMLFAGGLLVGSYQLEAVPNSLIGDEGGFWDRAVAIAEGRESRSFFDVGVYSYPLSSSFYQAAVVRLFGHSLWSWRFSSVLATMLTVIPLYLLAREMFDRRHAVLAGVLFVVLPYSLAFARMGYNNSQSLLPVALTIYLLYLALRRNSIFYSGLSGIAAGVGFYTYTAGRLGLAVLVGFLVCALAAQGFTRFRRKLREERRQLASKGMSVFVLAGIAPILMAGVTIAPHIVHTRAISPDLLQYKMLESLFPNTHYALALYSAEELFRDHPPIRFGDQEFFYRPDLYMQLFVRGVFHTMLSMHEPAVVRSHFILAPLAGPVSVVFYFIGFVAAFRHIHQQRFFLLLFWFMGGLFLLSMINTFPPRHQHFVPVIPVIALFSALGLIGTVDFVMERLRALLAGWSPPRSRLLQPVAAAASFVLMGAILSVLVFTNLRNYFVEVPQYYLPDLENIIAWDALALQEPSNFVYVYTDEARADWKPWIISYFPTNAAYQTLSSSDLAAHHFEFKPNERYTFYFPELDVSLIQTFLREIEAVNPAFKAYSDFEGRVIGVSISFDLPGSSARVEN